MDSNHHQEYLKSEEDENPLAFAAASISLSLSPLFLNSKTTCSFSVQPNKVKIPTHASPLAHLSLSTSWRISLKSTISPNPLQNPLTLGPNRSFDPSKGAAIRRASIVWFRNDLRILDNECLNSANNESISVLPVYCFDPTEYGKSSSRSRVTFLIESVSDLRKKLQERGSDLVVRIGKAESVLVELAKAIGADAVYAHREVSYDEVKVEERIEAAMKEENVEVKYLWGCTLHHLDDLPFKLKDMPTNYGGFREKAQKLEIRKTIEALDQLKGLPSRGDVQPGDIPSFIDLGLNPSPTMPQDGKQAAKSCMVGGESEALERLRQLGAECKAQPHEGFKDGIQDSIYGANLCCKIFPWLAMGCLSPRTMFDELKKSTTTSASSNTGTNWLMNELLCRDFFRFISKKCSSSKKRLEVAPTTTCT